MSNDSLKPKSGLKGDEEESESGAMEGVSAKALEELEERLVKRILSRVAPSDPGEGTSEQAKKSEQ